MSKTITISGDNGYSSEYAVSLIANISYRPGEPICFDYRDPAFGNISGIKIPVGMIGYEALQDLYAKRGNKAQEKQTSHPADWPDLEFQLGQEVYIHRSDVPHTITGIRLDERDEPDVPPYSVWQYRVGERWWYEASDLSAEPTARQAPETGELFLSGDETLP